MSSHNNRPASRRAQPLIIAVAVLGAIVLLLAGAYAGYQIGKAAQPPLTAVDPPPVAAVPVVPSPTQDIPAPTPDSPTRTAVPEPTLTATAVPTATATVQKFVPQDEPAAAETIAPTPVSPASAVVSTQPASGAIELGTFYEVWRLIESEFDGQLPEDRDRLYAAISGSLETLDDAYTRFIRPEVAARLRDDLDGTVSGIGAIVRPNEQGLLEIVRPIEDQPADRAGLLGGDQVVAVDGESVREKPFDEVLLLVRGPAGTVVVLTIVREGLEEPLDFSLVREEVEIPVVEAELIGEGDRAIGYVKLSGFTQAAETELLNALPSLIAQGPRGLIFDLRDNGGGFLDQAVAVADLFLPEGVILHERSSASSDFDETFRSDSGDIAEEIPLVVLVNAGSASASEIVAGAIQDNGRGTLVGESTFGKGSVQHVHTLGDGSELRVTIARWFTPNNRSIGEDGIRPDIEAPLIGNVDDENDPQLQRAIDFLLSGD